MKIGYLGVGNIASCMIEGFCGLDGKHDFLLSPRNAEKSGALAAKYGNVIVCESNQDVLDRADIIFISMLAANSLEVLRELSFNNDHIIINLIATIPPEDIREAIGNIKSYSHIVPLPYIKHRVGPIAAYPRSDWLHELLSPLGTVVFAGSMDDIRTMQAITALMSPFFELLNRLAVFAEGEGLLQKESVAFMSAFFSSLCHRAENSGHGLRELALDMTPGGLNEFCLNSLSESGAIQAWADIMEPVMRRIRPE